MSLTVEALAKEIRQIDENYGAGDQLATALLPFIERHIAAGQSPSPAELAAEYCRGRDDGWKAAEQKYRQPPKPAGAVPMPESIAWVEMGQFSLSSPAEWKLLPKQSEPEDQPLCTIADAIRYGAAREAAGRAVAERLQDIEDSCRKVYAAIPPLPVTPETADAATDALHAFCFMLGAHEIDVDLKPYTPTPIPQQPEAEGAAVNQSLTTPAHAKLGVIIATLESWLRFNAEGWKREGVENPPDDASVVANEWPTRSVLKNWIAVLQETALYTHPTPAADAGGVTNPTLRVAAGIRRVLGLSAKKIIDAAEDHGHGE